MTLVLENLKSDYKISTLKKQGAFPVISRVESAAYLGLSAYPVQIEVDVTHGLPQLTIVGLPDTSVKESRERIRAAIKNSGYSFPPEKITINLAPADIKKEGPSFDLPMALGILAATGEIPHDKLGQYAFLGELALDGTLRPFKGAIVITSSLQSSQAFVLPIENTREANLEQKAMIYPANNLREVVEFLRGEIELQPAAPGEQTLNAASQTSTLDYAEVRGQAFAKRAIEIAVSGGHNILFIGPPGSGKSMLSQRVPSILPPLSFEEALEITKVYSVAGLTNGDSLVTHRPFRSPHHSISPVALAGGGSWPKPGEISLAHQGVLFLDEFPEFRRDVLEALRSPLEEGVITISRAKSQITFPARIMLIAAMNPCPCGHLSDPRKACRCSSNQIQKYQSKISGPILDRIDLHVEVAPLSLQMLSSDHLEETSESIRSRIIACREQQSERYRGRPFQVNALMRARDLKQWARPEGEGKKLIEMAMKELHLSARAYYKILKIARTIADLSGKSTIQEEHIAEAIQYRSLDRTWWA